MCACLCIAAAGDSCQFDCFPGWPAGEKRTLTRCYLCTTAQLIAYQPTCLPAGQAAHVARCVPTCAPSCTADATQCAQFASPPAGFPVNMFDDLFVQGFSIPFLDSGWGAARTFFLIFGRPALRAAKSRADALTTSHRHYCRKGWLGFGLPVALWQPTRSRPVDRCWGVVNYCPTLADAPGCDNKKHTFSIVFA